MPGVPDIYQGDELLALSLVDPDNRRPVDWARRRELLEQIRRGAAPDDETRKLWLIVRALTLRAHRPEAFAGAYTPLEAGPDACAFLREDTVLVAAALRGDGTGTLGGRSRRNVARRAGRRRARAGRPACRSPSCSTSTGSRCSSALNETGPPRWDGPFPACGC